MNKKVKKLIEFYTLDISNAIMPKDWPIEIPKQLKLKTGEHEKDFDVVVDENSKWGEIFLNYYKTKNNRSYIDLKLPIGLNKVGLPVGSKLLDASGKVIAKGANREKYETAIAQIKISEKNILEDLKPLYPNVQEKFLMDYHGTIESLKSYLPLKTELNAYEVFVDIFQSGGGSTYQNGQTAMLGAYNSIIDFEVLKTTLRLFTREDLVLVDKAFKNYKDLTPIHSVISGQLDLFLNKKLKPSR